MATQLNPSPKALLRRPAVQALTGLSRTTIYRRIKEELFIPPVDIGGNMVGWPAEEVDAINKARIAGKSDDDIKRLVEDLLSKRKNADMEAGQ